MIKLIDYGVGVMHGNRHIPIKKQEILLSKSRIGYMHPIDDADGNIFTCITTDEVQPMSFYVRETPKEILVMPDIETTQKVIDWEQRRYEIAKDVMAAIYTRPNVKGTLLNVYQIVNAADALINELKKGRDNDKGI